MKNIFTILFTIISFSLFSQEFSMDLVKNMTPRNIGPGGMSWSCNIYRCCKFQSRHYVCWYSFRRSYGNLLQEVLNGIPIFDKEITASIGAVAIQQSNPSVIWAGTGEGNPRNSLNGGYGIYKSLDGGKNWMPMGLKKTRHIHRIIIDPTNPNTVYVGAIGSPWGEHQERGVYKTIDGGKTWKQILYKNIKTGVADLVMDPSNPNKLIAAMWEHKRDPWFFKSGGEGSGLSLPMMVVILGKKLPKKKAFQKGN